MSDFVIELPDRVSDARGNFRARAIGTQRGDGNWEGWLEFAPTDGDTSSAYTTQIETRQHERVTIVQWASGLTHADVTDALARAITRRTTPSLSQLLVTLEELVEALDRRIPQIDRAGEAEIIADASRLRACAMQRIALLRRQRSEPPS